MERKKDNKKGKKVKKEKGIRLRKINGGSFRTKNGRIIKPGQIFHDEWENIPKAFRDSVEILDAEKAEEAKKENVDKKVSDYFIQAGAKGWYDVVDGAGKKQNEKALRKGKADEMLKSLS